MYRLGSDPKHSREMVLDDIFRDRIDLLTLMANDYLRGKPLGFYQLRAMEKNAIHIEIECYSLLSNDRWTNCQKPYHFGRHVCHQLKLLALMIRSAAKHYPQKKYPTKEIRARLKRVTQLADMKFNKNVNFSNVA